jgi:5-methylcytosine-specific restriction endonuclease McrA
MNYTCTVCGVEKPVLKNPKVKYCSIKCQRENEYQQYIADWKAGILNGTTGKATTSKYIKRYIFEKQLGECAKCGIVDWNGQPIVLDLEHKDGNALNNAEDNLECLCPNCHSQTPTYKNRNAGRGRTSRRKNST